MKPPRTWGAAAILAAGFVTGCAAANGMHRDTATSRTAASDSSLSAACPMQVPGASVAREDLDGGVAMTFTTTPGDVAKLRERVRRMADLHNQHGATECPGPGCPHHGRGGHHGPGGMMSQQMMMPAATATAEEIEGGARLVLRPTDPSALAALRQHVASHVERMHRGECPMMGPGGMH